MAKIFIQVRENRLSSEILTCIDLILSTQIIWSKSDIFTKAIDKAII